MAIMVKQKQPDGIRPKVGRSTDKSARDRKQPFRPLVIFYAIGVGIKKYWTSLNS